MPVPRHHLFFWEDVPGPDSRPFLDHLSQCLGEEWVRTARIRKSNDKTIMFVTDEEHSLLLRLDETSQTLTLELSDGETHGYALRRAQHKTSVVNLEMLFLLRMLHPSDEKGMESLAREIADSARDPVVDLVRIHHGDDREEEQKATAILLMLENLALTPLLDHLDATIPEELVWDIQQIAQLHHATHTRILKRLEDMLGDLRPLKLPELPAKTEERYPPRRVRDEAYLLLRMLLAREEGEEETSLQSRMFLNMDEEDRDREIARWQQARTWVPLGQ